MNELERILGEVADGVSRRTDALPVDALRSRGVRRRRARQASFSAVGVAAAFGLALGAAQVLPGEEPPTAPALPSGDRSLPLGACGSIITSIPTVDASMSLDMAPLHLAAAPGDDLDLSMTVHHFGPGTLELDPATVPVLLVLREDVVVGWAWATDPDLSGVPTDGERTFDGFGPAVLCEQGELVPNLDGAPLPEGSYRTFGVLSTPDPEAGLVVFPGPEGSLRLSERVTTLPDPPSGYTLEDVPLPACGEPVAGHEFPAGTVLDPANELRVGEDSDTTFVRLEARWRVTGVEGRAFVNDVAGVVARDGVVVTYVRSSAQVDPRWVLEGDQYPWETTWYWLDCETFAETTLPAGEYELLAMRMVELQQPDGTVRTVTIGYEPVTFTLEDTSLPDANLAPTVELLACGEPGAGFTFPEGVDPATVRVAPTHSGTDEDGNVVQYLDGYGDQLDLEIDLPAVDENLTPGEGGAVVLRDGVVVATFSWDPYGGFATSRHTSRGPSQVLGVLDWVDCATGEHTQVPKGEYELLGWQRVEWWHSGGRKVTRTHAFGPTAFTVYDFEDPENPGPGA